ncbi:MAG: glycoside hydrolase family 57 protein [Pseudomonadota bacterium]
MQRTTLAIVWHMHQPFYRDMATGESTMPWVRLHAIHSYYDMIRLYERFPQVRGTINFVPSLVQQILAYTEEGKSDAFLDHTLIPAEQLTPQQKTFILHHFFMANPDRKTAPYPAYQKLLARRGLDPSRVDYQQAIRFFSTQDYLNLQVYYNLVWFGFAATQEIPEISQMLALGHFTEDDKRFVIDAQKRIMKGLLEGLRRAANSENVEICTTPHYHPILPLLIDTSFALRSSPKAMLPPAMKLPQMARAQVQSALDSMERWTGRRPRGMWPAEGSVCPEMIPMLADAGVSWMATDDRVLGLSLPASLKGTPLHQPFSATFEGKSIDIVFRDHGLSDLIGFTYSRMPAAAAIDEFLGHIKKIDEGARKGERLVTVILDGENPWEFYPESGREFLTGLFEKIEKDGVPTATVGGYLAEHRPQVTLDKLHTGSWIDANFNIWICKPQKNTAWNYIKRTIDELGDALSETRRRSDPNAAKAFESLAAACGSDWFWWYDDDFDSAFKADFDRIFRLHLKNIFTFLGLDMPIFLFEPIYRFSDVSEKIAEPAGFMEPSIDGKRTSFFEWSNAVRYAVHGRGGAMAIGSEPFEAIFFGFNTETCFLRLDPVDPAASFSIGEDEELIFYLHDGKKNCRFDMKKEGDGFAMNCTGDHGSPQTWKESVQWYAGEILEIAMSFAGLGFKPGEKMTIAIALHRHGVEIRRYSHIRFLVPDETYEQRMWSV